MKKSIAGWLTSCSLAVLAAVSGPACAQTPMQPVAQAKAQAPAQPAGQTRAQALFGDVNPHLAELTDDLLFKQIWTRPDLSPRDRSLVTVSALIALNRPDQLRSHLQRARDNGLTEAQLVEAITHLAFYTGWPNGVAASVVAKEVFQKK